MLCSNCAKRMRKRSLCLIFHMAQAITAVVLFCIVLLHLSIIWWKNVVEYELKKKIKN